MSCGSRQHNKKISSKFLLEEENIHEKKRPSRKKANTDRRADDSIQIPNIEDSVACSVNTKC
jgi:hypothetical protein